MKWLALNPFHLLNKKFYGRFQPNEKFHFDPRNFVVAYSVVISVWGQEIYERFYDDLLKLRDVNVIAAWLLLSLKQWMAMKKGENKRTEWKMTENVNYTPHRWNSSWT